MNLTYAILDVPNSVQIASNSKIPTTFWFRNYLQKSCFLKNAYQYCYALYNMFGITWLLVSFRVYQGTLCIEWSPKTRRWRYKLLNSSNFISSMSRTPFYHNRRSEENITRSLLRLEQANCSKSGTSFMNLLQTNLGLNGCEYMKVNIVKQNIWTADKDANIKAIVAVMNTT